MVELNEVSNIMKLLSSLTLKISSEAMKKNLRRMERDKSFLSLSDDKKIEKILSRSDDVILEEQERLERGKFCRRITYESWKSYMLGKFDRKPTCKEFLRSFQGKGETGRPYFERIRKIGEEILDNKYMILEVGYLGLRYNKEEVEKLTMGFREISDDFLDTVGKLENIQKEAFFRKSNKSQTQWRILSSNKNNQVNEIEFDKDLLNNNSIYVEGFKFPCVFDTGSNFSFITKQIAKVFSGKIKKFKSSFKLYTCLLEEFSIDSYAKLHFEIKGREYHDIFYILPKREDKMVIVGRNWMLKKDNV